MKRFSETPVGKAFAENAELQALIKKFDNEEKIHKRLMKKLAEYTVKFDRQKKTVNNLAGRINDLKQKIQYK